MYFTDRNEHCKEAFVANNESTTKTAKLSFWQDLLERFKGFLVFFTACILGLGLSTSTAILAAHVGHWLLEMILNGAAVLLMFAATPFMFLGVIWFFFPEITPHWRKRLTW